MMDGIKRNELNLEQIHELGLWEQLVGCFSTLEIKGALGLTSAHVDVWSNGWRVVFKDSADLEEAEYLVFLDAMEIPLRVKFGKGNGPFEVQPFSFTANFLQNLVVHLQSIERQTTLDTRHCSRCRHDVDKHSRSSGCSECKCPGFKFEAGW